MVRYRLLYVLIRTALIFIKKVSNHVRLFSTDTNSLRADMRDISPRVCILYNWWSHYLAWVLYLHTHRNNEGLQKVAYLKSVYLKRFKICLNKIESLYIKISNYGYMAIERTRVLANYKIVSLEWFTHHRSQRERWFNSYLSEII